MRRPLVGGRQPPSPAHQYSGVQNRGNDNMIEATILSVRKAVLIVQVRLAQNIFHQRMLHRWGCPSRPCGESRRSVHCKEYELSPCLRQTASIVRGPPPQGSLLDCYLIMASLFSDCIAVLVLDYEVKYNCKIRYFPHNQIKIIRFSKPIFNSLKTDKPSATYWSGSTALVPS